MSTRTQPGAVGNRAPDGPAADRPLAAGGSNGAGSARRVQVHNRAWKGMRTVTLLPDLDPAVDPASLRAALRRLHAADPLAPAVCRLEGNPPRWSPVPPDELDGWLDRIVLDERRCPAEDPHATVQRLLREPVDSAPFRVVVRNGSHAWQVDHMLGDGSFVFRQVVVGLVKSAVTGELATGLLSDPGYRHPLFSAVCNTFLRRPQWATWRAAAVRRRTPFHRSAAIPAIDPDGDAQVSTVTRTGTPRALEDLHRWRHEHTPDTSVATLAMAAARVALEAEGAIEPATDTVVMFDARRYLPRGSEVSGNFSAALRLTEPRCTDPRRLAEQVREDTELGLPLVSLLAATAVEALAPVLPAVSPDAGSGPVVLTHLGPLNVLRDLPRVHRQEPADIILAAVPSGPAGITVTLTEWRNRMNVTMTFNARFICQDAVARAAARLVQDPCGLLSTARTPDGGPARR